MSGADYINTITENASRLRMRVQESLSEHTRDISVGRLNSAYFDLTEDKIKNLRKQLDSNSDREKLDAMKRLIALISKGRNVSEYFAQVVKNVASSNLEIRKLVYIYLLRYAEQEPDLALLSINTFQKDLSDSNPLIRAMALRVLSGIRVPMIGNVVLMAIKKCSADVSPYVRKVAALATCKAYDLDENHLPPLIENIANLLRDRSPLSIGSVAIAFQYVCPTRLDLLHQHYRRMCRILVDVDEWGQVDLLGLLLRYARTMLPRPIQTPNGEDVNSDLKLLLDSAQPLFHSRNPAVVLAATRVFWSVGLPIDHRQFVQPLLRLLQTSQEIERVVLTYILVIARTANTLFSSYYSSFFLYSDDITVTKKMKIAMLLQLVNFDNHQAILRELIDYADDPSEEVVSDSIKAIGRCAILIPECTQQCLTALIGMIKTEYDTVVSSAVLVLKTLVQRHLFTTSPSSNPHTGSSTTSLAIISELARKIGDIRHPSARACIIWLVGEYSVSSESGSGPSGVASWAPDVLRKTVKSFSNEDPSVRLQIVILAAKLLVLCPEDLRLQLLSRYVFSLARYDLNYDVRDRGRMISSLVRGVLPSGTGSADDAEEDRGGVVLRRQQVKLVLFGGKAPVADDDPYFQSQTISTISSLGIVTGKPLALESILPDWLEQGVEPSLRDSPEDALPPSTPIPLSISSHPGKGKGVSSPVVLTPAHGSSPTGSGLKSVSGNKGAWADLDKFYEDARSGEEEESESDEDAGNENEEVDDESEGEGGEEDSEDQEDDAGTHR